MLTIFRDLLKISENPTTLFHFQRIVTSQYYIKNQQFNADFVQVNNLIFGPYNVSNTGAVKLAAFVRVFAQKVTTLPRPCALTC